MAVYAPPQGDAARLYCLKCTANVGPQDAQAGDEYVDKATLGAVAAFVPRFESAYLAVNARLGERIKQTQGKTTALADLQTGVRDFWEVGKRMVFREKLSTALLAYYGLGQDGSVPKSASDTSWLDFAAQIIKGEADALAAGYPAMSNPTAAKVAALLALAETETNQVGGSDRAYDQAQEEVAALRTEADALIQDVMEQLRFNLRKKDEASQRRIMRSYGAKFTYANGETPDAEEAADGPDPKPFEPAA